MKVESINISHITPYKKNAKLHPREQIEQIKKSIQMYGNNDPIAVWGEDNVIVEGHGRYMALCELGYKTADIIRLDHLTDEQRREYMLVHNQTTMNSGWDIDLLAEELDDLDFDGFDFGFDLDLDGILEDEKEIEEDEVPEKAETRCKLGDLWQLGDHKLICGDSTDVAVIDRLMDGVKAKLLLTDPPYGTTGVEWDCKIDLEKMWAVVNAKIESNSACVLFSAQPFTTDLIISNRNKYRYEIIWEKTQPTGFYSANKAPLRLHENIEVFYNSLPVYNPQKHDADEEKQKGKGRTRHKKADRCVLYGHVKAQDYTDDGTRYPTDVIHFSNWNRAGFVETGDKTVHPTQKPVEILGYLIKTYSNENNNILDLFGGSGSTLIACEQLNRRCYMAELDPKYVSVILQRYINFKGSDEDVFLLKDGKKIPYSEVK